MCTSAYIQWPQSWCRPQLVTASPAVQRHSLKALAICEQASFSPFAHYIVLCCSTLSRQIPKHCGNPPGMLCSSNGDRDRCIQLLRLRSAWPLGGSGCCHTTWSNCCGQLGKGWALAAPLLCRCRPQMLHTSSVFSVIVPFPIIVKRICRQQLHWLQGL